MGLRREGGPSGEHQDHGERTTAAQSLRLSVAKGGSGAQDVVAIRVVIAKRVHVDQCWHQGLRFWEQAESEGGRAGDVRKSRAVQWQHGGVFFEGPYRIRAELLVAGGDGALPHNTMDHKI